MLVNWPERFFCNSVVRRLIQRRQAGQLRSMRPMAPGGDVLEIGCGNGAGARFMVLDSVRARCALGAWTRTRPCCARRARPAWTARGSPRRGLPQGRRPGPALCRVHSLFDAVINFGIVHHLEDWRQRRLAEVARVLRPGGGFYFEEIYAGALRQRSHGAASWPTPTARPLRRARPSGQTMADNWGS